MLSIFSSLCYGQTLKDIHLNLGSGFNKSLQNGFVNTNGILDLNELIPTNFVYRKNKERLYHGQWYAGGKWWDVAGRTMTKYTSNCSMPISETSLTLDTISNTYKVSAIDTFIYDNNMLKTQKSFTIVSGIRKLHSEYQCFYTEKANKNQLDSILIYKPIFNSLKLDTVKLTYSYNIRNQLTSKKKYRINLGVFILTNIDTLEYNNQGNLISYKEIKGTIYEAIYSYTPQGQISTEKSKFYDFPDSSSHIYSYDSENRINAIKNIYIRETINYTVQTRNIKQKPLVFECEGISNNAPTTIHKFKITFCYQPNDTILISHFVTNPFFQWGGPHVEFNRGFVRYCGDGAGDIFCDSDASNDASFHASNNTGSHSNVACTCDLLSIAEDLNKLDFDFEIYPNPVNTELSVKLNNKINYGKITLSISNMVGQIVFTKTNANIDIPLNVAILPTGFYVVKIQENDKFRTKFFSIVK
jgi:YD repeat-containing protein